MGEVVRINRESGKPEEKSRATGNIQKIIPQC
jgi:hypothetical protein